MVTTKHKIRRSHGPCHRFEAKTCEFFRQYMVMLITPRPSDVLIYVSRDLVALVIDKQTTDGQNKSLYVPPLHACRVMYTRGEHAYYVCAVC